MKIAIVSLLPDTGHIIPLFKIGNILTAKGITVKYFGPNETQQLALDYKIDGKFIGNIRPLNYQITLEKFSRSSDLLKNIIMSKWFYINYFEKVIFNGLQHTTTLHTVTKQFSPNLILCDSHLFITSYKKLAKDLNVPLIINDAMGSYFNHQNSFLYENGNFYVIKNLAINTLKVLLGKIYTIFMRLFSPKLFKENESINKFILEYWAQRSSENLDTVKTLNISLGMGALEKKYLANEISAPNHITQLGPLPIIPIGSISTELNNWLNDSSLPPIIYIGFGTMIKGEFTFANHIITAAKKLGFRILWANPERPWPDSVETPLHVRWETWTAQTKILSHPNVKLFITHAGSGATQEALWFSKPTICIPFLWDQPYNAWVVDKLNCGITMKKNKITEKLAIDNISKALNLSQHVAALSHEFKSIESSSAITNLIQNHVH